MKKPYAADRAKEMLDRMQKDMREIGENPDMAKGTIGTVVLDLMRSGSEVSITAIVSSLQDVADGNAGSTGLAPVLAKGALKVISDLQPQADKKE